MGMIWRGVEGCETERPQVWAGLLWGGNRGLEIGHRLKGKGYGNMKWEAKWKRGLWYPPRKPLPGPMEREPCWRRLLRQEQSRWPRAQVPALTSRLASPLWVSTSSSTGGCPYCRRFWSLNCWQPRVRKKGGTGREESRKGRTGERAYQAPSHSYQVLVVDEEGEISALTYAI